MVSDLLHLVNDGRGGLGPAERFRISCVVDSDVTVDFIPELLDAGEHPAVKGSALKAGKPTLNSV